MQEDTDKDKKANESVESTVEKAVEEPASAEVGQTVVGMVGVASEVSEAKSTHAVSDEAETTTHVSPKKKKKTNPYAGASGPFSRKANWSKKKRHR
jgi:hypothetical protein